MLLGFFYIFKFAPGRGTLTELPDSPGVVSFWFLIELGFYAVRFLSVGLICVVLRFFSGPVVGELAGGHFGSGRWSGWL